MADDDDLTKVFGADLRVDLRGGERSMAEQFLHGPQIGSSLHHVGCRRVTKDVG